MKPCTYCGRQNEDDAGCCRECGTQFVDPSLVTNMRAPWSAGLESLKGMFSDLVADLEVKRRWLVCFLGWAVLALAVALLQSSEGRRAKAPRVVVLATWSSNGEQLVTFRLDPPSAKLTYVDLVSASYDGNAQPPTVRRFGNVLPVRNQSDPNFAYIHFVALPIRASSGWRPFGRPLTYTPGSYTVAYAPTGTASRLRAGVALPEKGIGDYLRRLRNCWEQKTLTPLRMKLYHDPTFVTPEPIPNAVPGTR